MVPSFVLLAFFVPFWDQIEGRKNNEKKINETIVMIGPNELGIGETREKENRADERKGGKTKDRMESKK